MSGPIGEKRQSVGRRLSRVLRDVRILGLGAPLRAGYEASKRAGGHTLVFRHLVPTSAMPPAVQSPFEVRNVPTEVRKRTVAAAERISDGTIDLFGQEFQLGDPPDWAALVHTEGGWPEVEWWRIDLRSENRPGDVKWTWELGRHRHLVILARAAHLDPSDARFEDTLNRHLSDWIRVNAPESGVHWYSNLEISLRAISWLQILSLIGDRLRPDVRIGMIRHLHHAARHLMADLPYTVSTMRNNHLLGDSLGLVALGTAFGGRAGNRWRTIGDRIFRKQLHRHMRPDGSMIEDSVCYHRFVLEMLSMRVILGGAPEEVRDAMRRAAQFLARLGALDGPIPQYGDWDEGRVIVVAGDPSGVAGTVRLALALAGDGAPETWRADHDEVAWFAKQGSPVSPQPADTTGIDMGAGMARVAKGPFTVWLKGGSGTSHGHADLSSVAIAHRGNWLIGDPGTGSYNGPIEVRNYFRGSAAHNVSRVGGIDQLEPHRAFRWVHEAQGRIGEPVALDEALIMWTVHDAYTRLTPSRRIARVVIVRPDAVEVTDYVEGTPAPVSLGLTLHPSASWNPATAAVDVDGERFHLELPGADVSSVCGQETPYAGWWSDTYGIARPTTVLRLQRESAQPIQWAVRVQNPSSRDFAAEDRTPIAASVFFDEATTRLRVDVDGRTFLRSM